MAEPQHEVAVYFDELGSRKTIKASDLANDALFAFAKLLELYDESGQIRLFPRDGNGNRKRHFFCESASTRFYDRDEGGLQHDQRVSDLINSLNSLDPGWRLVYQDSAGSAAVPVYGPLPRYDWGAEITRILGKSTVVRHDLYGDVGIRMSLRSPAIAIEVVHSHYPEEATFSALLTQSENLPFIVLFDFTRVRRNQLVSIDKARRTLAFRKYTFLIRDGSVWLGRTRRADITSAAALEVAVNSRYHEWR